MDVDELYRRHGELVDKKFLEGLTPEEEQELTEIRGRLDDHEATVYTPMTFQAMVAAARVEAELREINRRWLKTAESEEEAKPHVCFGRLTGKDGDG